MFLLEASTGSRNAPTVLPSATLIAGLPTTSSGTALHARSLGSSGYTVAGPCNYVNPAGTLVAVNCETIEAPTKKIIDVEQCYPVTRTVCSEC